MRSRILAALYPAGRPPRARGLKGSLCGLRNNQPLRRDNSFMWIASAWPNDQERTGGAILTFPPCLKRSDFGSRHNTHWRLWPTKTATSTDSDAASWHSHHSRGTTVIRPGEALPASHHRAAKRPRRKPGRRPRFATCLPRQAAHDTSRRTRSISLRPTLRRGRSWTRKLRP